MKLIARLRRVMLHERALLALKSGLAAGLGWAVGARFPGEMAEYAYYASLGGISVIYPAVSDSVREAFRATAAIILGALVAALMQVISWPNALTVAPVVVIGTALGGLRFLGEQRHWVATAALFVLIFSGDPPQDYILIYVGQILTGALIGLGVNAALPKMNLTSLSDATEGLRAELVVQLRRVAELLREHDEPEAEQLEAVFDEIDNERDRLRQALEKVKRSTEGNPRAVRYEGVRRSLQDRARSLAHIAFMVQDVGVVLQDVQRDDYRVLNHQLRRATATAFAGLADVIVTPTAELAERVREDVTALMNQVHNAEFDDVEGRYLAGIIAASAQLSLSPALSSLPVVEDS
ncbi:FUSC family protein [Tessaracoccus massiliensis]|uniref:FUSC family protein n=1 Tax=Tessaracoccus massiliensis TaxID=1522311 RepID=UPI00058BD039|nr:hypothetical protein [Tessaracoccus massiliensis]